MNPQILSLPIDSSSETADLDQQIELLKQRKEKLAQICALKTEVNELEVKAVASKFSDFRIIRFIVDEVCTFFSLHEAAFFSPRRLEYIAFPRQVAMYLARLFTNYSLHGLGEAFRRSNGKEFHHGTILHACRLVTDRASTDPEFARDLARLTKTIKARVMTFRGDADKKSA